MSTPVSTPRPQSLPAVPPRSAPPAPAAGLGVGPSAPAAGRPRPRLHPPRSHPHHRPRPHRHGNSRWATRQPRGRRRELRRRAGRVVGGAGGVGRTSSLRHRRRLLGQPAIRILITPICCRCLFGYHSLNSSLDHHRPRLKFHRLPGGSMPNVSTRSTLCKKYRNNYTVPLRCAWHARRQEPAEERRAASVPDYAPPQPPSPAALWRQSGGAAARHARSSTPSRPPPPPPPGPDDAAWKARKKCPVFASAPLSSYDAFIREHLIAPPTPPARAPGPHVCGGKAARGDGAKWACHCSSSFDRRSPIPFALGGAAWDEGEKSGKAPFGAGPLRKEQRSQEAEVSPCRDSDLQACAPPTRPGSGDGSGAGRGSSPDPGQRLRLSPFRQIAELPKIVEFAEDSSLESTSVDSGHTHSQDASDQGKPLIIRYRKIESNTESSPPHSSVVFHFNGSPLEAEDRNLTPGTLSIISSDSKTGDGNDSRGTQPQKYVVPYIQEVKMIMENLESMLESRVRNDVALITSKSTSSQTGPEMLVECRSRLESSARRQERRPESAEYEAEETGETRRDASDTSLDNTMGTSEYGSLSSQSKRGVSVKHSLSSLTGKARTAKRCGPPRCPIGEKVIVPCLAHNRIKRSRSGSYIHDDHFALKMLVPEFHVVHTNCSCQKNRDKLS
ncbi:Protein of unknown function [Gryllus bimaculatus]|nr:Protein of unknown function [Gryllus bimaculatus]